MSPNFRIMRDGNGVHWVEEQCTTFFLRRKVWRARGWRDYDYCGGSTWRRRNFTSKDEACAWLREHLAKRDADRLHRERAKQHIDAGPC
jgi:hypothetical protein